MSAEGWSRERKRPDRVGLAEKGNAKAEYQKAQHQILCSAEARFDRESDTKESDRVGNARPKGKPGGKPERVS
ncbi:hypothetical protein ACFVXE_30715, partial [Streptomyces sp. NPDC058231]|uniref:hypothetical protein n=1 Tax=Streptomyces sp. NPDC058231 TaxID=3346392 RepID=UPI0036EE21D1